MREAKPIEPVSGSDPSRLYRLVRVEPLARADEARGADTAREEPAAAPPEPSSERRPYRVVLDRQTQRIFIEVIDPRTGDILLRIPPGYALQEEPADSPSREIKL